ncbi:MAG: phospho-sugar mutase [Clostridiales bacterium]|nr:phospho-sugar mutase [Clostridiales bacterium]
MTYQENYEKWAHSAFLNQHERKALADMAEDERKDAFYKNLEFGTAGMRGVMSLGTNRINIYTIRLAAKGLSKILKKGDSVAIAYDTRNHSKEYAYEVARVLAYDGIKSHIFDDYSPVPLLSFAVRELKCDAGVVITASHNTKEYNGFKVYDNTGCQMTEKLTKCIADNMDKIKSAFAIPVTSIKDKNIALIGKEIGDAFIWNTIRAGIALEKLTKEKLTVVYTPIHGSGFYYVQELLRYDGFNNISIVESQANFDGNFSTVKKPNPEDKEALALAAELAMKKKADIVIGTDPDCDRIGAAVMHRGEMVYISGNQVGALLIDFIAKVKPSKGKKLITTIVTGEMGPIIAESYGIEVIRTLTGFKYIGSIMNEIDEKTFFMGYEESYGYLAGTHARDKDGVSAALLICQIAAYYKEKGKTLIDALNGLYEKYGYWIDDQESFTFQGQVGEDKIKRIMSELRAKNGKAFCNAGNIIETLDYRRGINDLPEANVLKYVFTNKSWVAIRPSGTEPKIKFYYCINGEDKQSAFDMLKSIKTSVETVINVD